MIVFIKATYLTHLIDDIWLPFFNKIVLPVTIEKGKVLNGCLVRRI